MLRGYQSFRRNKCLLYTLESFQTKLVSQNGYGKGSPTLILAKRESSSIDTLFPSHHVFADRHIGPSRIDTKSMLDFVGVEVKVALFSPYIVSKPVLNF